MGWCVQKIFVRNDIFMGDVYAYYVDRVEHTYPENRITDTNLTKEEAEAILKLVIGENNGEG